MHLQTHFLSGWCIGNLFRLNGRERLFCALAAVLPDLDGIGIIFSQEAYWKFHHLLGHNLLFSIVTAGVFCCFSRHKVDAVPVLRLVPAAHGHGLVRFGRTLDYQLSMAFQPSGIQRFLRLGTLFLAEHSCRNSADCLDGAHHEIPAPYTAGSNYAETGPSARRTLQQGKN